MTTPAIQRIHRLSTLVLVGLIGSAGCGDGGGSTTSNNRVGRVDAGADAGTDAADPDPTLDAPATIDIRLDPARAVYNVGAVVQRRAIVYDGRGDQMDAVADLQWSIEPEAAVNQTENGVELAATGALTFEACIGPNGDEGRTVCGQKRIIVDNVAPSVTITKPAAGAWLGADGATTVAVEGEVSDPTSDQLFGFVNGRRVSLDDSGQFSTTVEPAFGINHVTVTATDGVSQDSGQALLDYIWAPDWYDTSNTADETAFEFDDGLALDLGQRFFDDGHVPEQTSESSYHTDDLADILSLLVKNIDFLGQVPDPLLDTEAGQLRIIGLTLGEPEVIIDLTDTGAELNLWVPNVQIQTRGNIAFNNQQLDLDGTITADIAGFASLTIDKLPTDPPFEAEVDGIELSLQNAQSNFNSPEANAVFELAESALRTKIETILVDTLRGQFIDQLPDLLAGALNSVAEEIDGLGFDLNTEFTDALSLTVDGSVDRFETTYRDSMLAVLATRIATDSGPELTGSPGIPLASEFSRDTPFFDSSRAQVGVRLSLLNGLLHALWESGFLEIDLTDLMPDQYAQLTDDAQLSAKLQPVLSPPKAGQPYDFILRAGQMQVQADLLDQTDTYGVNLEVGILMSLQNNSISITVPDEPKVTGWVIQTDADEAVLTQSAIEGLILDQVWPQIEETLRQGLSLDLPVPSLGGVSTLAPTLGDLEVQFLLNRPVALRGGYVIFDTKLQGTLPLGP